MGSFQRRPMAQLTTPVQNATKAAADPTLAQMHASQIAKTKNQTTPYDCRIGAGVALRGGRADMAAG